MMPLSSQPHLIDLVNKLSFGEAEHVGGAEVVAIEIPWAPGHRVGIDYDGNPVLLINTAAGTSIDTARSIELKNIRVRYATHCKVSTSEKVEEILNLTLVACLADENALRILFLDLFEERLGGLEREPTAEKVRETIRHLVALFKQLSRPRVQIMRGLWGELLTISESPDPDKMVNAWHDEPERTFDFVDGLFAIEVKTCAGPDRIHRFGLNQVKPEKEIDVVISSIIAPRSSNGVSVIEIMHMVASRLISETAIEKLRKATFKIGGEGLGRDEDHRFDIEIARESLRFIGATNIPAPSLPMPPEVSEVSFRANLNGAKEFEDPITVYSQI